MVPLRVLLESNFASLERQLTAISDRLEGVEARVAETNGQLISHRGRLTALESRLLDPAVLPLATLANGRFVGKVLSGLAVAIATLWSAYWAVTKWVTTMAATVK